MSDSQMALADASHKLKKVGDVKIGACLVHLVVTFTVTPMALQFIMHHNRRNRESKEANASPKTRMEINVRIFVRLGLDVVTCIKLCGALLSRKRARNARRDIHCRCNELAVKFTASHGHSADQTVFLLKLSGVFQKSGSINDPFAVFQTPLSK